MANRRGKKWLRTAITLCLFPCVPLAHAGTDATARDWCKEKTLRYLKKHGYEPYNWAATTDIEGDNYVTKGEWSVDADEIKVECTTNKHGKKKTGKYKILDIEIFDDGKLTDLSKQK
jgi:hypothetical protein